MTDPAIDNPLQHTPAQVLLERAERHDQWPPDPNVPALEMRSGDRVLLILHQDGRIEVPDETTEDDFDYNLLGLYAGVGLALLRAARALASMEKQS